MRSICSLESQLHFRSAYFISICSRKKISSKPCVANFEQSKIQSGKFVDIHRLPSLIGHKPRIVKFAFSPDSTRLVTLDNQEMIKVWEMNDWANQQTPRELLEFKNPFG